MSEVGLIRGELRRALHGPAWHGPALLEVLEHVTPEEAWSHPIEGAHSIAEIVQHCLAWTEEVAYRLDGGEAGSPRRGDWASLPEPGEVAWMQLRSGLLAAAEELDAMLAGLAPDRLKERVATSDPDQGGDLPIAIMLHGLAQHHAYHGGQVVLLTRAARAGP
jgi:uncharacterized damage-inducible protein DinB